MHELAGMMAERGDTRRDEGVDWRNREDSFLRKISAR